LFRIIGIVISYKCYGLEKNNKYYIKIRNPYLQVLFLECGNINIINTYKFNLIKNITEVYDSEYFLNQEIVHLKIVNIREIEYEGYVYDLEVDKYHNYMSEGIICHNTCAAIAIAEKFKPLVQRYGTKIHILVPGPHIKENWKKSLISCTGNEYTKQNERTYLINEEEKEKNQKQALANALQYYKIPTYKSFYRKVLGEKIVEKKVIENNKIKISYKKTDEGLFERDISIDRLVNLNNTLLIIEEAHNLTGNYYGEAVKKIIDNSINLKIILLTATPMKNTADEIIELLNFLRPTNSQIKRDLIFTNDKTHLMTIKEGGLEYLKNMARGYVSHLRGADPITFAKKKEMGVKPKGLLFTKIVQCKMDKFQKETYEEALKLVDDSLDRKSEAVANFVFPGISEDKKKLSGLYGREGLNTLKNQLKNHHDKINSLIAKEIYGLDKYKEDYININEQTKNITGAILKKENLSKFSTKFHRSLSDIYENIFYSDENKESRISFVYSNLVKIGIELYQEILIVNGWLEYDEKNNYQIKDNTICYYCACQNSEHDNFLSKNKNIPEHKFQPATFIVITGQSNEEIAEIVPENKIKILDNVFSNIENKDGKLIKIVLGSKVMNEGISLRNVKTVHILDVYFNFGRVDQVVARAIRWCSHFDLMNKEHPYPEVKLYKYAVTLDNNQLSTEENLYYKAELKYLLIKKVERGLKEVAIDCPLFREGNVFKDEIKEFNKCIVPKKDLLNIEIKEDNQKDYNLCPSKCDFTNCDYQCEDKLLITKYYDPSREIYKKLGKGNLDYSTFTSKLARGEIEYAKKKILELYMTDYVYNLETIVNYVKESYDENKKELFDNFFVEKALDELIPISENDFNNYKDIIYDKTSRAGYLIYLDGYYIFQPFDENENVSMFYRTHNEFNLLSKLSLYNYINNEKKNLKGDLLVKNDIENKENVYNFDEVMDYYDNREEFKYVGIVDREINRGKTKLYDKAEDIFKLREKREKILEKKRGTGIPSIKGAVCATSKKKEYLEDVAKLLGLNITSKDTTRDSVCRKIREKLIEYEKYAKGSNKMTYIMIPSNHETLKFPLNIEDRNIYLQNKINQILSATIKFNVKENKNSINLSFSFDKISKEDINKIKKLGFETNDNKKWNILID
jgi:DNA-directed RNA polymerase subunit H (RpoH/RPB5)